MHYRNKVLYVGFLAAPFVTHGPIDGPYSGTGLIHHFAYMRSSRLNLDDEDGIFSLPGVIRDDLRPFDPLDGTALQNRTRISH